MITFDSLFGEDRKEERDREEVHDTISMMSVEELRETILESIMDTYIFIRKSPFDETEKLRTYKKYRDYAVVARRGSEDVVREMSKHLADFCVVDDFIASKMSNVTTDEPSNMDTMENMEKVLKVISDRYKKYIETGEIDPALGELTLERLMNAVVDSGMATDDARRMATILTVTLHSIMYVDETLMFYTAPDDIAGKFIGLGIDMIANTGAPASLKRDIDELRERRGDK